jgi:hypothetical protein
LYGRKGYTNILDSIGNKIIIEGADVVGSIKVTIMNAGLFFATKPLSLADTFTGDTPHR